MESVATFTLVGVSVFGPLWLSAMNESFTGKHAREHRGRDSVKVKAYHTKIHVS